MIPLIDPLLERFPLNMEIQKHHKLGLIQLIPGFDIIRNAFLEIPSGTIITEQPIDMAIGELQIDFSVHVAVEGCLVAVQEEVRGVQVRLFAQKVHHIQSPDGQFRVCEIGQVQVE